MRRSSLSCVGMMAFLLLVVPGVALALPPDEAECCGIMNAQAIKYFQKHVKIANKCTFKMEQSSNPAGEKCDDKFDPTTGGTDFVIDKFKAKFVKKMKKKCMKKLGLTTDEQFVDYDLIATCGCNAETSLADQIDCKLEEMALPSDLGVCGVTPLRKNSNRGNLPPPDCANFCDATCP